MGAKAKVMLKIHNQYYQPGETVPDDVAEKLVAVGLATETASVKPPETATLPQAKPKHLGGGWYLTESGKKVRKKDLEAG